MPEKLGEWGIHHFSLSNPTGEGRGDVPKFLRHLADTLDEYGAIEIQDISFTMEIDDDGEYCPTATVYFHPSKGEE